MCINLILIIVGYLLTPKGLNEGQTGFGQHCMISHYFFIF
jgi:hypothetical protein